MLKLGFKSIGLSINFKLKRLVELLTVEQRREMVIRGTQKSLPLTNTCPTCLLHETKPMEYYCETCRVMICGQCMLDDHRIHGNVKFANTILKEHVQELQKIIPDADNVIVSGEDMILSLKSEVQILNDELTGGASVVSSYFEMLHSILQEREKDILSGMKSRAKKKERRLQKHTMALNQAIKGLKRSKMTLEDAVENRSNEVGILMEENQLRAFVLASMRLVEDEAFDCKSFVGGFSNFPTFKPDPSVEGKCRSISYSMDSPVQRRSKTAIPIIESDVPIRGARGRAGAFISSERKEKSRKTLSGHELYPSHLLTTLSPLTKNRAITDSLLMTSAKKFTIPNPVSEIGTKSLVGSSNHVAAYPFGVCCSSQPEGALLVTDAKLHLFRIIASTGECLETIGTNDGQFFKPVAIAVDEAGSILVLDGKNPGRVQKFSKSGKIFDYSYCRNNEYEQPATYNLGNSKIGMLSHCFYSAVLLCQAERGCRGEGGWVCLDQY